MVGEPGAQKNQGLPPSLPAMPDLDEPYFLCGEVEAQRGQDADFQAESYCHGDMQPHTELNLHGVTPSLLSSQCSKKAFRRAQAWQLLWAGCPGSKVLELGYLPQLEVPIGAPPREISLPPGQQ